MKTTRSSIRTLRRSAPPLVAAAVAAAAVFVPTSASAGSYAISDDLADATKALNVLPDLEGKTDEEVERLLGANPDLARKVDEAEAKVADALARIGGDSDIEQARLLLKDLPNFGGMTDAEIREYLAANPDQARKIEEASRLLSGKDGAESGGSSGEAGSGGFGDNSGGSSQDVGDGEDWAATGDGASSTNVLDDVFFGELKWDFGGFKAEDAEKGEVCISGLKMQRDGLRFKYVRDLSEWGVANPEDATEALACLFVVDCDGKWVGGKFDWISSSRETRDFKNVYSGYNGWDLSNVPNPTIAAFVIVHKDGKRRSNVISAMWER